MAQLRAKGIQCYGIGPALTAEDDTNYGAHSDVERLPESSLYQFVEFTWRAVTEVAEQSGERDRRRRSITTMAQSTLFHVDVFATGPLTGNGLAVFLDTGHWPAFVMQRLTQELKQFESIFLSQVSSVGAVARGLHRRRGTAVCRTSSPWRRRGASPHAGSGRAVLLVDPLASTRRRSGHDHRPSDALLMRDESGPARVWRDGFRCGARANPDQAFARRDRMSSEAWMRRSSRRACPT